MTRIIEKNAKSALTKQTAGFLISAPYPFTHSLNVYTGCQFGKSYCGSFCYAPSLPNWQYLEKQENETWGDLVSVKSNLPVVLNDEIKKLKLSEARDTRIFCSSTTDPYMPLERQHEITRSCLSVFARYPKIGLLVVQTRSVLAERDFDIMQGIPYLYLSVSVETDDVDVLKKYGSVMSVDKRLTLCYNAVRQGLNCQIVISPCLPYTGDFLKKLIDTGVTRFVVDTFTDGDGTNGVRTSMSKFAQTAQYDWKNTDRAKALYDNLACFDVEVGWSSAGFCGIPSLVIDNF